MVMMLPPQVRYSSPQQMAGDDFFMGAPSPRVDMSSNTLGELAGLVASANVDPMYREAVIANPNYNMPGSAEAHARYGIPPVVVQSDPYATLAFAAGPGGSVAPLIGYPSRYPHVLNGVPTPYGGGTLGGLLAGLMQMGRSGQFQLHPLVMQAMQQRRAGGTGGTGGRSTRQTQTEKTIPGPTIPPPEVRYAGTERIPGPTIPPPHVRYAGNVPTAPEWEAYHNEGSTVPPVASQAAPVVGEYRAPVSGEYRAPASGEYRAPVSGEYRAPASGEYRAPVSGEYRAPVSGEYRAPVSGEYRAAANMTPVAPVPVVPGNAVAAAAQRLGWVNGLPPVQPPLMVQAPTMRLPAVMLQR